MGGEGLGDLGNGRKKTFFSADVFPYVNLLPLPDYDYDHHRSDRGDYHHRHTEIFMILMVVPITHVFCLL